ncbi:MAG: polysaccharide biosynthesis protein, partial [Janthinobacterium sp.]
MIAITADFFLLPLTFCLAIGLRYDVMNAGVYYSYLWLIIAAPLVSIPIFIRLGLYRAVIRFIDQKIVYVVILG